MGRRVVCFVLFISLMLTVLPFSKTAYGDQQQAIAGYGPVYGNLVMPSNCKIIGDKIFVMDVYGISAFSLPDRQFLYRFPVDFGTSSSTDMMKKPKFWMDLIKSFSDIASSFGGTLFSQNWETPQLSVLPAIESDSANDLYISSLNGISHFNEKGDLLKIIPIPEAIMPKKENESARIWFRISQDALFLLVRYVVSPVSEEDTQQVTHTIYQLSREGEVLNKLEIAEGDQLPEMISSFLILPDRQLFVVADALDGELFFIDQTGQQRYTGTLPDSSDFNVISIEVKDTDTLVMLGMEMRGFSFNTAVKQAKLTFHETNVGIKWEQTWKKDDWGMGGLSLSVAKNRIGFVCSGKIESMLDYQVNVIDLPDQTYSIGKPINEPGQINLSISNAVDEIGNLYTTNLGSSVINVFDQKGEFLKTIEIDRSEVSSVMGMMEIMPMITSMYIEGDMLYLANLMPNSITRYNLKTEEWEQLYKAGSMGSTLSVWLDMYVESEIIYLLNPIPDENGLPQLSELNEDLEMNLIEFPVSGEIPADTFYTGFEMDNNSVYVLEGMNSRIYQWLFPDPDRIKKTIQLEHSDEILYSSFCRLESGDFVMTDPFHDKIILTNKDGKPGMTWGTRVPLTTGREKSVYQTNETGYNIPLTVKEHNRVLYINDFLNCRYHIMIIPLPTPQIKVTDFVYLKDISVFRDHTQTIEIAIESEFLAHFQVKTDQDWIQIKEPTFTSNTKELHITLIGSKMKPWANNYGYLHISCDEADLNNGNNLTIELSVDTVGIKIQLTIDDPIALFNDVPQPALEAAPFVIDGRTMVPVRLIAEGFGAQIDYDSVTREITIRSNGTIIQLQTGNPNARINGKEVKLDVPPVIRMGRTFVPLRFISEAFGAKVDYESTTRRITILYPAPGA